MSLADTARRIGVSPPLVTRWESQWEQDRCWPWPRGRPLGRSDRRVRNEIIHVILLKGPQVGVRTLQPIFPGVARRELEDLLYRYREVYRRRNPRFLHTCRWSRVGAVWAMDYTEPPLPIDDIYEKILMVRDLASGKQLLSLPAETENAEITRRALELLFVLYGPPLVVKSDNGSPLIAQYVRELFQRHGVYYLRSPAGTPEYNGSCEAGIGALKTRAHHLAALRGFPAEWTCCDVETARVMANQTARPNGHKGPTPDEAWVQRQPITSEERGAFLELVRRLEKEELQKALDVARESGKLHGAGRFEVIITRRAVRRALMESGILVIGRTRIRQPISGVKC